MNDGMTGIRLCDVAGQKSEIAFKTMNLYQPLFRRKAGRRAAFFGGRQNNEHGPQGG